MQTKPKLQTLVAFGTLVVATGCPQQKTPENNDSSAPSASSTPVEPSTTPVKPLPSGEVKPSAKVEPPKPPACTSETTPIDLSQEPLAIGDRTPVKVTWSGALNDDSFDDLIVQLRDSCSSYGECEHSVYVGCGGGRFAGVYGPEYSISLELAPGTQNGFRNLTELRRKDTFEEPGATPVMVQYAAGKYVAATPP